VPEVWARRNSFYFPVCYRPEYFGSVADQNDKDARTFLVTSRAQGVPTRERDDMRLLLRRQGLLSVSEYAERASCQVRMDRAEYAYRGRP
jgi:hypothetical protein